MTFAPLKSSLTAALLASTLMSAVTLPAAARILPLPIKKTIPAKGAKRSYPEDLRHDFLDRHADLHRRQAGL